MASSNIPTPFTTREVGLALMIVSELNADEWADEATKALIHKTRSAVTKANGRVRIDFRLLND